MLTVVKDGFEDVFGRVEVRRVEANPSENVVVAQIESLDQPVAVEVAWNESADFLAGSLDCPDNRVEPVLDACESVADELNCGSVVFAGQDKAWAFATQGYSKQYIYPIGEYSWLPTQPEIDFSGLDGLAESFRCQLERLLEGQVRCSVSNDDRPLIFSIDWSADFHGDWFKCFLHLHPLTGAAYLEELVIPERLRFSGIGSRAAQGLKSLVAKAQCSYFYLTAKQRAEEFWEKQGFGYVYRLNRRGERRRVRALKRTPGWDRGYVGGRPLPNPTWSYRNHPQDDLDLYSALRDWPFAASGIRSLLAP